MDSDHREIDEGRGLIKRYLHGDNNKFSLGSRNLKTDGDAEVGEINGEKDRTAEALRKDGEVGLSIEELFDSKKVPPWWEQITLRGIFVSFLVGTMFSIIMMKLNLTTGLATTMNISAGLLGFVFMRSWSKVLDKAGLLNAPFTRQENTVIQTCVVACYSTAYGGGFGSYLLGMNRKTYEQAGIDVEGNTPNTIKQPSIGWMIGFLFLVTFGGLLVLVPLRKVLIINKKLTYPSGTATAVLINGFHTPQGDKLAKKQIRCFAKFFTFSFFWGFFQWFFTGGDDCGFVNFPTFGLKAWKQSFYFDFSTTYVGAGMICPHIVNISLLIGAVASWGLMWPLINNKKGKWFPEDLPESNMKSLNGYKVFVCIALILGDGLYNFVKIIYITLKTMYVQRRQRMQEIPITEINASSSIWIELSLSWFYASLLSLCPGRLPLVEHSTALLARTFHFNLLAHLDMAESPYFPGFQHASAIYFGLHFRFSAHLGVASWLIFINRLSLIISTALSVISPICIHPAIISLIGMLQKQQQFFCYGGTAFCLQSIFGHHFRYSAHFRVAS